MTLQGVGILYLIDLRSPYPTAHNGTYVPLRKAHIMPVMRSLGCRIVLSYFSLLTDR